VAGSCEHANEPSRSIKGREFLDTVTVSFSRTHLHGINYFSRFRPPRKHTASQLQRSVGLCLEGTSEHGNEPSGYIEGGEFLDRVTLSFLRTLLH
jgi:hypothetical protein